MPDQVEFSAGSQVRLINDPGRVGVLSGRIREQAGTLKYQVIFPEGPSFQPDYELELIKDDNSDWVDLLEQGRFGRVRDLRRSLTHIHLSGRLANLVYSMDATNTDFYAYQYKPVLSFLDSPSNGLLIADEVGLGKTIEAGLIWTELRARLDARRLLVVCPAMLREKWEAELSHRFGVNAEITDAKGLLKHLKEPRHKIQDGKGLVCSLQGLRPTRKWREGEEGKSGPKRDLARFLDAHADEEPLFDLVIFDEAHYMRNPESQTAKLGQLLRNVAEHVVLLSATPINLKSDDLFHLLNLVDPDTFGVKEVFPQVLAANAPLQRARELCLNTSSSAEEIMQELLDASEHELLSESHQLRALISEGVEGQLDDKRKRIRLANKIERINLLRNAVTRTRKSQVTEWRVVREPVKVFVDIETDGPEYKFYQAVTEAIRNYAWEREISDGFLLSGPQRQVSSCMYAAARAWKDRVSSFSEQIYEDSGQELEREPDLSPLIEVLERDVLPHIDLPTLRANDSKYKKFKDATFDFLTENPAEKIVVFSFFRRTLSYLSERLAEDGIKAQVLVGGMSETKQEIIEKFKSDPGIRVLLSSEVASEGVDLQFCRVVVNYDLPWNPMKVEQRIGRIDRLGQQADKISIFNLFYGNTIDHRIHDRLYERLHVFENALGGMEAILGEEIKNLTADLLTRPLTPEQEYARIEQTALALEQIRRDEDELESQASHLIAHGGYILDEVKAAHQFKKRITDQDLVSYVKDYLEKYCVGHEFRQASTNELKFDVKLPADAASRMEVFIKERRLQGQTRLATGERVSCLFANKVRDVRSRHENISQFHPLVRFISDELRNRDEAFYPLIAAEVTGSEEALPGTYVFYVNKWEFSGIKHDEELPVRVWSVENRKILDRDESWALVNQARVVGRDWPGVARAIEIEEVVEGLEFCGGALENDFLFERNQRRSENLDRISLQIQSARRHMERQLNSRQAVLQRFLDSGNMKMVPATKGRIASIKEKFVIQEERLKQKSELSSSQSEVCVGVIRVI
ncbi:hypothetical protein GCM10017044_03100 [Kordiimonas sediminis]|uniref:Helicase n=1 Tax=Kordiimonas sediminis TaxID=1735581 RepID=A0A919E4L2_9PROT|nr:helicase-related protein [Kordiimonas sediminis]GHF12523.1 hypothetical protein GCM10017044_03100 [Kordiimonas sediminis]